MASVTGWLRSAQPEYDYGVIELEEPVGERLGWFALSVETRSALRGEIVNVAGFPADKPMSMWHSTGKIEDADFDRVYYVADTYGGTSGGAAWISEANGSQRIVAVHAYGVGAGPGHLGSVNSGTRVTPHVLQNVARWREGV